MRWYAFFFSFLFLWVIWLQQVEHPVTEMISSVDLIEEQIRVAMGEKLRYKQVGKKIFCKWRFVWEWLVNLWSMVIYRKILCFADTQLNAASMQKMPLKGFDLDQVWCYNDVLQVIQALLVLSACVAWLHHILDRVFWKYILDWQLIDKHSVSWLSDFNFENENLMKQWGSKVIIGMIFLSIDRENYSILAVRRSIC